MVMQELHEPTTVPKQLPIAAMNVDKHITRFCTGYNNMGGSKVTMANKV